MITSKKQLKEYILADLKAHNIEHISLWKEWLRGNLELIRIFRFQIALRKYEYAIYKRESKGGFYRNLCYLLAKHRFERLRMKTGIYIGPNVFDSGLNIVHLGYFWINSSSKIGKNCTVLPRVLLGKKHPGIPTPCIIIGDNCYIGTGVSIMGPVTIGNNVTIGAGAVVTKDFPDNCVIAGNPAKIIKYKNN